MPAFEVGSFSRGATGNFTLLLNNAGLTPSAIDYWIGARAATNETDVRFSVGMFDGTNQTAMSIFDGVNHGTRLSNTKSIRHYIDSGGATLKLEGTTTGFAAGQVTGNMTTIDSNFPIYFKAHF